MSQLGPRLMWSARLIVILTYYNWTKTLLLNTRRYVNYKHINVELITQAIKQVQPFRLDVVKFQHSLNIYERVGMQRLSACSEFQSNTLNLKHIIRSSPPLLDYSPLVFSIWRASNSLKICSFPFQIQTAVNELANSFRLSNIVKCSNMDIKMIEDNWRRRVAAKVKLFTILIFSSTVLIMNTSH